MTFGDPAAARFLLVGVGNTFAGLMIIYAAKAAGIGDLIANAIGYGMGFVLSFCLNRQWTFRHRGSAFNALARFVGVIALAYGANLAVVLAAIDVLGINSFVGQALGVPVYAAVGYLGSSWYVFPGRHKISEQSP